jgi:hypothetical protein
MKKIFKIYKMKITKICCIGAGYVVEYTMAVITQNVTHTSLLSIQMKKELQHGIDDDVNNIQFTDRGLQLKL